MDLLEIDRAIAELEAGKTTFGAAEKLAVLYTVRDHSNRATPQEEYSYAAEPQSEFVAAASSAPIAEVLAVLDDHMDAIKAIYPKEYTAVINRIRSL